MTAVGLALGTYLRSIDKLPEVRTCRRCEGTGLEPRSLWDVTLTRRVCTTCHGAGEFVRPGHDPQNRAPSTASPTTHEGASTR